MTGRIPPAWRTIDGGRAALDRGPLTQDEIRQRRNEIAVARGTYQAEGVAARMERELVADVLKYGQTWRTRTGRPIKPIDGGNAA